MRQDQANLVLLMGMAGGPQCANEALMGLNNEVCGKAYQGRDQGRDAFLLEIPYPGKGAGGEGHDKAIMEQWGFDFTGIAPTDRRDLTRPVPCPPGWSIKSTEHWLYKDLLDPQGQVRAQLMLHYQDRDSWISLRQKYCASAYYRENGATEVFPTIKDSNGKIVWVGKPIAKDDDGEFNGRQSLYYKGFHAVREKAEREWAGKVVGEILKLKEEFPELKQDELDDLGINRVGNKWDFVEAAQAEWNITNPEPKRDYSIAAALAGEVFEAVLAAAGVDAKSQELFETPLVFPPDEGTIPIYLKFGLRTDYHHESGSYADGGSHTMEAVDETEALELFEQAWARRSRNYLIKMALRGPDGKELARREDRPKPMISRNSFGYDGCGFGYECDMRIPKVSRK